MRPIPYDQNLLFSVASAKSKCAVASIAIRPKESFSMFPLPEIESPLLGFFFAVASARLTSSLGGTIRGGAEFFWAEWRWVQNKKLHCLLIVIIVAQQVSCHMGAKSHAKISRP